MQISKVRVRFQIFHILLQMRHTTTKCDPLINRIFSLDMAKHPLLCDQVSVQEQVSLSR
jgi:hypothetical protein